MCIWSLFSICTVYTSAVAYCYIHSNFGTTSELAGMFHVFSLMVWELEVCLPYECMMFWIC
jgi:hypothetical protein